MKTNRARWIACLLACAIGVSLTACGKDKKDSSSKNASDSVAAGEESSEEPLLRRLGKNAETGNDSRMPSC